MINLSSHIEYLLLRHDCVVVPGLGAFLVHEVHARFDADSCTFMPPSRSLGFNPAVTHNDGLLVESVARKERVSIEVATQQVQTEVSSFRHQLAISGELPVGALGVITVGSEPDALLFEPSEDFSSVSVRYRGLSPVSLRPLVEEEPEHVAVCESKGQTIVRLPLKIAASLIFLLVTCGILYSTTNLVDSGSQTYASLDSGLSEKVDVAGMMAKNVAENVSREIILSIAYPSVKDEAELQTKDAGPVSGNYLLVVASFPTHRDAERHIAQLGASDLSVVEMDGKFRVFASSHATSGEAYAAAEDLRGRYPSVWVCRR